MLVVQCFVSLQLFNSHCFTVFQLVGYLSTQQRLHSVASTICLIVSHYPLDFFTLSFRCLHRSRHGKFSFFTKFPQHQTHILLTCVFDFCGAAGGFNCSSTLGGICCLRFRKDFTTPHTQCFFNSFLISVAPQAQQFFPSQRCRSTSGIFVLGTLAFSCRL